jgi:hypothetical protein
MHSHRSVWICPLHTRPAGVHLCQAKVEQARAALASDLRRARRAQVEVMDAAIQVRWAFRVCLSDLVAHNQPCHSSLAMGQAEAAVKLKKNDCDNIHQTQGTFSCRVQLILMRYQTCLLFFLSFSTSTFSCTYIVVVSSCIGPPEHSLEPDRADAADAAGARRHRPIRPHL